MKEEFEYGDIVEVRNNSSDDWERGKFLVFDAGFYPYVVRKYEAIYASGYKFCRKARPNLKIDDPVWVTNSKTAGWLQRYFARWSDNGRIRTFNHGTTSHTNRTGISTWEFYSLENPEEDSN